MDFNTLFGTMKFKSPFDKTKIEAMYNEYVKNIPDNFYKNQFDLAKDYPGTSFEDWVRVLTHPAFDSWKAEQIALIASTQTDKALAGGDIANKDAVNLLNIRTNILTKEKKVEKPTIIVMPESLFFEDEDE